MPLDRAQDRANAHRGEATLVVAGAPRLLRPTFTALVAAEEELGPLFALVERAAAGQLRLGEMTALFWHCLSGPDGLSREAVGEAVVTQGLAACAKPLRALLAQILQGAASPLGGLPGSG
jgi:hypothetical protein